jgi:hypothetical protein
MQPEHAVERLMGFGVASAVAGAATLLTGCAMLQPVASEEEEALRYAAELAAGKEMVCRYERPLGSKVKQRICVTHQEAELRELQAEVLYRNSLIALHGGTP